MRPRGLRQTSPNTYPALEPEHYHPATDELFIVIAGCLAIDLDDGREIRLGPWQSVTIPAGVRHRTRALGRTINLCVEKLGAGTVFVG